MQNWYVSMLTRSQAFTTVVGDLFNMLTNHGQLKAEQDWTFEGTIDADMAYNIEAVKLGIFTKSMPLKQQPPTGTKRKTGAMEYIW